MRNHPPYPLTRRAVLAGATALAAASGFGARANGIEVPWGIAVETEPFKADTPYREAIAEHAGLIAPMNALKWASLRYERDVFDFDRADAIIAFAEARGLPVHGHTLLWYAYNPAWLDAISDPAELETVLREHIARVAGRYPGRIASWDVVNEVIAHDPIRDGRWREGVWHRVLGAAHVEIAFEAALEAAPDARMMINDYDLEDDSDRTRERQDAMIAIVDRLQAAGHRVDAVGMQAHLYAERPIGIGNLERFVLELASRGVGVAVTELDVIDWRLPQDPRTRDALAADLVDRYLGTLYRVTRPHFVTTWGLSDRYSWIGETFPRNDTGLARPLPLDRDLVAKPMEAVLRRYTGRRYTGQGGSSAGR